MFLGISCYLRPNELLKANRWQLQRPIRNSPEGKYWILASHPKEEVQQIKTGASDKSLPLDLDWQTAVAGQWAFWKEGDPEAILAGPSYRKFYDEIPLAGKEVGVSILEMRPYQMRHTGISSDIIRKLRTLRACKKRARLASDSSLVR